MRNMTLYDGNRFHVRTHLVSDSWVNQLGKFRAVNPIQASVWEMQLAGLNTKLSIPSIKFRRNNQLARFMATVH